MCLHQKNFEEKCDTYESMCTKEESWGQNKKIKQIYNEEFDPGSGWTLAAGLIHASRGATGVAIHAGDRRTGA